MLCVKFVEIGPVVVEKKILIFFLAISLLHVSPLGKRCALHLNKLEFSLPKDALCRVWLKLVM